LDAAGDLDAGGVFVDMLKLPPQDLVLAVQQLLKDAGEPLSVDGILGQGTGRAILEFCERAQIKGCQTGYVTREMVIGLLTVEPAKLRPRKPSPPPVEPTVTGSTLKPGFDTTPPGN
jgi:hypothetical protein